MRKLFFGIVLALGSLTACGQNNKEVSGNFVKVNVSQDNFSEDNFSEIETHKLPDAVTKAIDTYYPSAIINKAFVNNSEQFKLEIILKEGKTGTIYTDKDGEWIER